MNHATIVAEPGVILIADDNLEARRMLEVRVKREGHRAVLVENGRQALDYLAKEPVDVILLDIDMPEVDGFAVLRAVKGDPKLAILPVLIISGGTDDEDLVRCIELGAVDFLPKPFNQALLRARVNSCLMQKRQREQELQRLNATGKDTDPEISLTAEFFPNPRPADGVNAPNSPPKMLGRIEIKEMLGHGAMGHVYLGHHQLLDLPVAVKLLRPELLASPGAKERLLREARLAVRLAHRHIVRLLEVGDDSRGVYLAFEYVSGGTLNDLLSRQLARQVPIATAIRITQEVAFALGEANRNGITHRDIKPANLLLTPEGEVKIADFGLAKQESTIGSASPQITMEGMVVGTPLYMAPEQATPNASLDVRTDLYALGCVLYEMLTGRAPLDVALPDVSLSDNPLPGAGRRPSPTSIANVHVILYHQMHTSPTPPASLRAEIPAWLDAVCLKLLAKRPDDRFASPEALLSALQAGGISS